MTAWVRPAVGVELPSTTGLPAVVTLESVSFTPSTRSLIVLLERSTGVPLSESLALPAAAVMVLAGALPPTLSCASPVESPLSVNALSVPVGPFNDRRALPSVSVMIVAETPLFAALIALAMPSSVLLVESIVTLMGVALVVKPETAASLAVPSVSVSVPEPTVALRLSNLVVLVVVCAVASCVTSTNADSPESLAPDSALAVRMLVSLLVGWVWRLPPLTSVLSPEEKLVIALCTLATDEICAVSVVSCLVSWRFLDANCAWTSEATRLAVSTPDPALSELSSDWPIVVDPVVAVVVVMRSVPSLGLNGRTAGAGETLGVFRSRRWAYAVFTPFSSKRAVSGTKIGGGRPPASALRPNTNASTVASATYRSSRTSCPSRLV
ncbi:hypothetical protein ABIC16_000532 [Sphingomonas sp. PvP055]